jgi:branched-chain amino acid aminotransferase
VKIYLDGKYVSEDEAKTSVFDHGLLYGDGVFEGIRLYGGRIFRLEQHLDRLLNSAKAIMLTVPLTKEQLVEACCETCRQNKLKDGYIRLVVTRGVGSLGLNPFRCKNPTVFIIADTIDLYPDEVYRKGLKLVTASTQRTSPAAVSPSIKSLNYLNNILAKIEAVNAGADEAIMLNSQGHVAECTGDNIFVVRRGKLEVFLTGTAAEIAPVVNVDGRIIGSGHPGPLTLKLTEDFRKLTRTDGVSIGAK